MRKIFVVIIFMLMAIPVYAHVYDPMMVLQILKITSWI